MLYYHKQAPKHTYYNDLPYFIDQMFRSPFLRQSEWMIPAILIPLRPFYSHCTKVVKGSEYLPPLI